MRTTPFLLLALFTVAADECEGGPIDSIAFVAPDHDAIDLPTQGWDDLEQQWASMPSNTLARDAAARERFETALNIVLDWADTPITQDRIVALHAIVTGDDSGLRTAGQQVGRGGINTAYAPGNQVAELMGQLDTSDPALLDRQLMEIHPFSDGNGRVARLVATWARLQA